MAGASRSKPLGAGSLQKRMRLESWSPSAKHDVAEHGDARGGEGELGMVADAADGEAEGMPISHLSVCEFVPRFSRQECVSWMLTDTRKALAKESKATVPVKFTSSTVCTAMAGGLGASRGREGRAE